ncbi:hypothetical protein Lser_V15G10463 [Lactuca serriola]
MNLIIFSLNNCMRCSYLSRNHHHHHHVKPRNTHWWMILFLLSCTIDHLVSGSNIPTHSNFFRAVSRGRQRALVLGCGSDPNFCSNPEKNPWGGSVCCFGKFCKDVKSDGNHCGVCGHVCGYELVCCDGECVDVRNDNRHCGGCFEECLGQGRCSYAMCDYG